MTQTHITEQMVTTCMLKLDPRRRAGIHSKSTSGQPGSRNQVRVSIARRERRELGPGRVERSRRHHKSIPVTKGSSDRAPNTGMFDVSVACVPLNHAKVVCPNRPEGARFKRLNAPYGTGQSEREWHPGVSDWCHEPGPFMDVGLFRWEEH